ncbi:hypothetical protein BOTBODRAFT_176103 [Botryobasidium botryosum FD-172 SS1]|uniref:Uncharacterized protein n=1 Tax=Botryobasidium botryosum (strain FD-172 SS1) TaxID=930990 RepID=A0A067MBP3_BOTB1|nr:hypothetical protein BOTBODRAFT_176103 [Botryobasidium botryosum FD-172 SS1]
MPLPNEILLYIFELGALEDIKGLSHLPVFPQTVSHVCRLWREISLASPTLWTLFHPLLPPNLTSRAKPTLLDFVIRPRQILVEHEPPDIPTFGRQLIRACSLRHILESSMDEEDLELMQMLYPAPHLTTLLIRSSPGRMEPIILPDQLFAGHHPRLSEISIYYCGTSWTMWTTSLLSNLRVLELVGIPSEYQIAIPVFLSVLRACPQLQVLHLDNSGPLGSEQHQPAEPIVLPALHSFRWVNPSDFSTTRTFLRGIVAHSTVRIRLCSAISDEVEALMHEGEEHSSGGAITLLEAAPPRPRALALTCRHKMYTYIEDYHVLEYDTDMADHVSVLFPRNFYEGDRRLLFSNLANRWSFGVQSITLTGILGDDPDHFVHFFHALPNITMVSLDYCQCDDGLIDALTDQSWGHRVEDISFRYSGITSETILDLARSRTASSENPDHTSSIPLRRLSFNQCMYILDETLESLRALVPEVIELWPDSDHHPTAQHLITIAVRDKAYVGLTTP